MMVPLLLGCLSFTSALTQAPLASRSIVSRRAAPASMKVIQIDKQQGIRGPENDYAAKPLPLLRRVEELGLLSAVADAGLLSAAEEAGVFSKLEASGGFSKIE